MTIPRILSLPTKTPYPGDAVRDFTDALKSRRGTMTLRPIQAEALYEAMQARGLFAPMQVGTGKTLVSLLLPVLLGAKRPILFTRAALRQKTWNDFFEARKHWGLPKNLHLRSYEELSRKSGAEILERYEPDLIICDEVHRVLGKVKSTRGRRLWRYMDSEERPPVMFAALSGTMLSRSVQDMWQASLFALGTGSPVPYDFVHLTALASVCDHKTREQPSRIQRRIVSPLVDLAEEGDTWVDQVRDGFRRRLHMTPGVVVSFTKGPDVSLEISKLNIKPPKTLQPHLDKLRELWMDPDGNEIPDPLQFYNVMRQITAGFYYRTVWPDGVVDWEWLDARNAWNKLVRNELKRNQKGKDSPLLIFEWYHRHNQANREWSDWVRVKDRPAPPREVVWLDDYLVTASIKWARAQKHPVILWYEHTAIEEQLQKHGIPTFGAGTTMPEKAAPAPVIAASWRVHSEGCNLQYVWSDQLILQPPPSPRDWEQLLGRMHREGQEEDVRAVVAVPVPEIDEFLTDIRGAARTLEKNVGVPQKLNYADWT